jgi:hypothetical protein
MADSACDSGFSLGRGWIDRHFYFRDMVRGKAAWPGMLAHHLFVPSDLEAIDLVLVSRNYAAT